jgi:C4-dicarboxylate-specific signal transduction histidine kinase
MERERNPREKTFDHRLIQTKIGQALRTQYDQDFSAQRLPHRLFTLLMQLNEQQRTECSERPGQKKPNRSESNRASDALEATRAQLARAARTNRLGAMAASIAHEINQPLAAMVANSNAALRWLANATPDLDEARAALRRIGNDGRRAAEVIEGIRAMFKNDGQKRVPLDLNQLVREVLALVQGELLTRRISIDTELNGDLPQVMANWIQLQQVIMNLITNAIDAMASVTDRQRILRVKSEIQDGDAVVVAIEDSGTGIDPEQIDRLFDTFFTTKPQGMGMGLSICRLIIEAHNGRLWASAGAKYGSVFWFKLPTQ